MPRPQVKETYRTAKETYRMAKEASIEISTLAGLGRAQAHGPANHLAKETYHIAKETYHIAKETYHIAKETYRSLGEELKKTISFCQGLPNDHTHSITILSYHIYNSYYIYGQIIIHIVLLFSQEDYLVLPRLL